MNETIEMEKNKSNHDNYTTHLINEGSKTENRNRKVKLNRKKKYEKHTQF